MAVAVVGEQPRLAAVAAVHRLDPECLLVALAARNLSVARNLSAVRNQFAVLSPYVARNRNPFAARSLNAARNRFAVHRHLVEAVVHVLPVVVVDCSHVAVVDAAANAVASTTFE